MTMNRLNLPDIAFCETDTAAVEREVITEYERITEATLYPGDPVRLFLEGLAYLIAQQRFLIDYAGKMNLLHYSQDGYLDHLGNYLNTLRLAPAAADVMMKFTLSSPRPQAVIIPRGVRVSPDEQLRFVTTAELIIPPGGTSGSVIARCETAGDVGNGYLPGQINKLVDPVAYVAAVVNTTESSGGADAEKDENLRARVQLAAEQYAAAGPAAAYVYHARKVSSEIADVAVWQPAPGRVRVAPLLAGGQPPGAGIIAAVAAELNRKEIRPLTDRVNVVPPESVAVDVAAAYTILTSYAARTISIQAAVKQAVDGYVAWQTSALGRAVTPSQLTERIQSVEGVERVTVSAPVYRALEPWERAVVNDATVTYEGLAGE